MVKKAILVDLEDCIGCYNCVVRCQLWHKVPADETRIKVHTIGPAIIGGVNKMSFIPEMTEKCELGRYTAQPPCVSACPVEALKWCDERQMLSLLGNGRKYQVCKIQEK